MSSEHGPALVEIKVVTGLNPYDTIAVADMAAEVGEEAALTLLASVLRRLAAASPMSWSRFCVATNGAADAIDNHVQDGSYDGRTG